MTMAPTIGTFIRPVPKLRYCYKIVRVIPRDDEGQEQWWCKRFGYDPGTDQPIKDGHQGIHYLNGLRQIAPDVWKDEGCEWYVPLYWRKMAPFGHQESMF